MNTPIQETVEPGFDTAVAESDTRTLRILRLALGVGEQSAPYQQFSRGAPENHKITLYTYFPARRASRSDRLELLSGDGTVSSYVRNLRYLLKQSRHDVIHAHTPHVGVFLMLAAVGARSLPPTVLTVHNSYRNFRFRNRIMLLPLFAWFSRVVCCGKASYESFPWHYRRFAGNRMTAISNGVDLCRVGRVVWRQEPAQPRSGLFRVTSVNRLISRKDPTVVLRAFCQLNEAETRLTVIGEGRLRPSLTKCAAQLGISDRVEFTGLISRDEVYRRLSETDLFVSASRGEGLPLAVLEAMACGCPIILSDIAPHREIVDQADFIPLFQPGDYDSLTEEIRAFHAMTPSERQRVGQSCKKLVEERFSLRAMHRAYENLYVDLVNGSTRGPS